MLDPQVLGQLLVMQSYLAHLPDQTAVFSFVCRGLADVPGVRQVVFSEAEVLNANVKDVPGDAKVKPLRVGDAGYGALEFHLDDPESFAPYEPYVDNFCFMTAVILEDRHQKKLIAEHQDQLEHRVRERTAELQAELQARKKAEEDLRENEEKFRAVFENSYEAIGVFLEGFAVMTNPALARMFRLEPEDFVTGDSILDWIEPSEHDRIRDYIRLRAVGGDAPMYYQTLGVRKNREIFDMEVRVSTYRLRGKLYTLVILQDVGERNRAVQAIADERERLSVTLRSIGDGVITTDTEGRVVIMNPVAENLTGWPLAEARGRPLGEVFQIINEVTEQPCEDPVSRVLRTHCIIELANHTVLISRQGDRRVIADSGAPIFSTKSQIIGVVLVFRDTTEKQKLLETVQRADKLESLGVLAGGIAHDFNNLLGGLFGYVQFALETSPPASPARDFLEKGLKVYERAKDLTHQLLTFAKGGNPIRKTAALGPLVKDTTQFALTGSGTAVKFELADDLYLCDFDENQLAQVIDNIVINAKQAMEGSGSLTVTAENTLIGTGQLPGLPEGLYVRLTFTDSGPGISKEILPKIFDPFFTTKPQGNGLGLATSFSIINRHEGFLDVTSQLGVGTSFRIWLPKSRLDPALPPPSAPPKTVRGGRVLLVDDEDFILELGALMLESLNYQVDKAANGDQALEKIRHAAEPYAFILADLTIPGGKGGVEIQNELAAHGPSIPVIASSGYSEDPIMAEPQKYGFAASVKKPYLRQELADLLMGMGF